MVYVRIRVHRRTYFNLRDCHASLAKTFFYAVGKDIKRNDVTQFFYIIARIALKINAICYIMPDKNNTNHGLTTYF